MEYVKLGNSPLTVSRLCVGCMSFGDPASRMHAWTLDPAESEEIVKHALSLGINFFDTANTYSAGTSEEYLGRAIRSNVPRDQVILASKVYFNEGHLSREAILPQDAGKISLCFALPHVTGSLSGVLQRFAMAGLNLTKIESRPIPQRKWEYRFFVDFEGNLSDPAVKNALRGLQAESAKFRIFGNY